jgi:hypothetical protein
LKDFLLRREHPRGSLISEALWKSFFIFSDSWLIHCSSYIQGVPFAARIDNRTWCCPCDACFAGRQNARLVGSWRLPHRFKRKAQEARQCVAGTKSLWASPERVMCKAVRVKALMKWIPQNVRDVRNLECLPKKVTDNEQGQPERKAM